MPGLSWRPQLSSSAAPFSVSAGLVRFEKPLLPNGGPLKSLVNTDSVHGFIDFEYTQGVDPSKEERLVRKRAAALALRDRIGDAFRAVVSGTSKKATWLRIIPDEIEGRLVRGRRGLTVGDETGVVLLSVDPVRGFIDFARQDTVLPTV